MDRSALVAPVAVLAISFVGVGVACGPSFQTIYEGDARFEHCYAMDENANVALAKKGACWHDWALHFTYGQTRDRVDYAFSRDRALSQVPNLPTDDAMMQAAPGSRPSERLVAVPAPTNAFAPPPVVYMASDAGSAGNAASATPVPLSPPALPPGAPNAQCTEECATEWKNCGDVPKTVKTCDRDFKKCMRFCFRDDAKVSK